MIATFLAFSKIKRTGWNYFKGKKSYGKMVITDFAKEMVVAVFKKKWSG